MLSSTDFCGPNNNHTKSAVMKANDLLETKLGQFSWLIQIKNVNESVLEVI
jgi:hypothetical protein